jgi:hypothetical protein
MSVHSIYKQLFKIWRANRFRLFVHFMRPGNTAHILDVGGYPGTWINFAPCAQSITCLNIHPIDWEVSRAPQHGISVALGDGRNMDTIEDRHYDIVFSNSVIEHVGNWDAQQAFAREIRRVGRNLWVQTPAKGCPVEPHYLAPFVHWLPKKTQKKLVRWFSLYGLVQRPSAAEIEDMVESIRLLTKDEMQMLFPDCEILTERMLICIPKSYIAIRKELSILAL